MAYASVRVSASDRQVISNITQCYATKPYAQGTTLQFARKIEVKGTAYFVFYVIVFTDIELVYAVGRDGSVRAAYVHNQL
jgi:hypothetical protein